MNRGGKPATAGYQSSRLTALLTVVAVCLSISTAPAQTGRLNEPTAPTRVPRTSDPVKAGDAGACCDDAAQSCTEFSTRTTCESKGFRYGGDGSTCDTMEPPCRCADVLECPACITKTGEGTRQVTIGLIDVSFDGLDTTFTYQICRDADSQQLSNWVLGLTELCCQRIVAVTSNAGTSSGTCGRDPVSGLFGLKWETNEGVPICNEDGCGGTDDPGGPALFSVMLSGAVPTGCVKTVNKIDGPPAEAFGCVQGPECGAAFCGDDEINLPGETCDGTADAGCAQPGTCRPPGDAHECTCCGDGTVQSEAGEECEPPGTETCNGECRIISCGDGVVNDPSETCDGDDDAVCAVAGTCRAPGGPDECTCCGDGILQSEAGEECEPPGTETCDSECRIISCGDGVVNDPSETCDGDDDAVCAVAGTCRAPGDDHECTCCGDGFVQETSGETCDPPGSFPDDGPNACRDDCTYCGDGVIDPVWNETCDPPGSIPAGSDNACRDDCTYCGDGILQPEAGEECEPPGTETCDSECRIISCGDGVVNDPSETCDGDDDAVCAVAGMCREPGNEHECTCCGDGFVQETSGETCDPPGTKPPGSDKICRMDCTFCGDGIRDPGEECDGADMGQCPSGSVCSSDCRCLFCGDDEVNRDSETCDGDDDFICAVPGSCRPRGAKDECTCCGDGDVQDGSDETCDPPGVVPPGAINPCRDDCTFCGDGNVDEAWDETCDPPGSFPDDGPNACRDDCTYCGDGNVDPAWDETCDLPGSSPDDGPNACRDDCTFCGDGIIQLEAGEECEPPDTPTCDAECRQIPFCGDDEVNQEEETCDGVEDNVCAVPGTCRPEGDPDECTCCGDGDVQEDSDETCDPPGSFPDDGPNMCRDDCTFCGDGILDPGEECDGADLGQCPSGSVCSSDCRCLFCGDNDVNRGSETCDLDDDGICAVAGTCRPRGALDECTCCGDGIVQQSSGERCDPPGAIPPGAANPCRDDCTFCGDGEIDPTWGETCDPPDAVPPGSANLCRADCTFCGDGIFQSESGEQCEPPGMGDCDQNCRLTGLGACCLKDAGATCVNNVVREDCPNAALKFFPGQQCSQIDCRSILIPTASTWGMVVMALLLLSAAKVRFGRRPAPIPHR